eukprot:scaffold1889_cov198-Amphora_coffeaeformis.AAC.7
MAGAVTRSSVAIDTRPKALELLLSVGNSKTFMDILGRQLDGMTIHSSQMVCEFMETLVKTHNGYSTIPALLYEMYEVVLRRSGA